MQKISVQEYQNFEEISKKKPEMTYQEIDPNNAIDVFQNIFCNTPFRDYNKAPIFVNLSKLKEALYAKDSELRKQY